MQDNPAALIDSARRCFDFAACRSYPFRLMSGYPVQILCVSHLGACRTYGIEAKNGLGEDRFCRIRSANSELLVKKLVKYDPVRRDPVRRDRLGHFAADYS